MGRTGPPTREELLAVPHEDVVRRAAHERDQLGLARDVDRLRADVNARKIKTGFRTGWQADYPGMYNFLQPLYSTKASSNDTDYSNKEFDSLLAQGASQTDQSKAVADYQKAQEILFKDLPAIPLWYSNVTGGYAEGVKNVTLGWNSVPLYYEITKG